VGDAEIAKGPFNAMFNGAVLSSVHVGDSWYFGGDFTATHSAIAPRLMPLTAAGEMVASCNLGASFDGDITSLVRSGSSIYVGGAFSSFNGMSAKRIAKLDAVTCALDTTFSPPAANGFDSTVTTLLVSGSSIYVGGVFTAYRGVADSANRLAKLDLTSGAIDTSFGPAGPSANGFDGTVYALATDGTSLFIGGGFSSYRGAGFSARNLAKVNATTGALDTTFSPAGLNQNGFDSTVYALALSGTSVYAGGGFGSYKGVAGSASRIAKLNATSGALDTTFSPPGANGFNSYVYAFAVSGTSLYVAGNFSDYRGVASSARALAKLDLTTGALDTAFTPSGTPQAGIDGYLSSLQVSNGRLFIGGGFKSYKGVAVHNLASVDLTTGAVSETYGRAGDTYRGTERDVMALASAGGDLWVGGRFKTYGGISANRIAKLNDHNYTEDTTFSPAAANGFDDQVVALASDGTSLFVGGRFEQYRGVADSTHFLAKINLVTGALDPAFSTAGNNGFDDNVLSLAVSGTTLYAGGDFSAYRGVANSANHVAKLDASTGAIDTTFSPVGLNANGLNNRAVALAVNGTSLYAGGDFTGGRGVANSAIHLAKLDTTTGAIDTTFSPAGVGMNGFDDGVAALTFANGSLYVGGYFSAYRGVADSAHAIAKLDGTTGALDTTFSPPGATANGVNRWVYALTTSANALYIAGAFSDYRGVANSAFSLAKVDPASGALDTTFGPAGVGMNGFASGEALYSLAVYDGSLFVGGDTLLHYRNAAALGAVKVDALTGALQ